MFYSFLIIPTSPQRPFPLSYSSLWPLEIRIYRVLLVRSFLKSQLVPETFCFSAFSSISSLAVRYFCGLLIKLYPPLPFVGSAIPTISILAVLILNLENESVKYQLVRRSWSLIILEIVNFYKLSICLLLNYFKTFFIFSLLRIWLIPTYFSNVIDFCIRSYKHTSSAVN